MHGVTCSCASWRRGAEGLQAVIEMFGDDVEGREENKARCLWRLGKAHWEMGGEYLGCPISLIYFLIGACVA